MKKKIYCKTDKERDKVLKRLEEMGCRWKSGHKPTEWEYVCCAPMIICIDNDHLTQSRYEPIYEAEKWLEENPKYKQGDLFQIKPNIADLHDEYPSINDDMKKFRGRIVTLQRTTHEGWLKFKEVDFVWLEKWLNPIKEENRAAKPDEFVKVINASNAPQNEYKNGDILKIVKHRDYLKIAAAHYKDEYGKYLASYEYVVLEGYEDCDQVKKFDEFVSHLKTTTSNDYGTIGDDTQIKDALGRALKVGDTVKVFDEEGEDHGEKAIVKDKDKPFVMGCKSSCKEDGSIDDWVIIKKRNFEEIKDGETVDDVIYVKSKCLNTKICITRGDYNFKTGKVYKVIDGKIIDDSGDKLPCDEIHLLKDIEDLKEYFAARKDRKRCEIFPHWSSEGIDFVEVVE